MFAEFQFQFRFRMSPNRILARQNYANISPGRREISVENIFLSRNRFVLFVVVEAFKQFAQPVCVCVCLPVEMVGKSG